MQGSILTACLLSADSCPDPEDSGESGSSQFPDCTGQLKPSDHKTMPELLTAGDPTQAQQTNVTLTRITDNSSKLSSLPTLRHHYSRRQAWNLDETLLDLGSVIVNASSYEPEPDTIPFSSERLWSNTDPDVMFGIRYNPEPIELSKFNFKSKSHESLFRFESYKRCTLGRGEGNLSNDDTRLVVTCTDDDDDTDILSLDLPNEKIMGKLRAAHNMNWASISPSGKFVVVENNKHPDPNPVLLSYSSTLENETLVMKHPSHGDLALDDNGDDIHVMITANSVYYVRIKDRQQVTLGIHNKQFEHGSGHISCRNLKRPGWCYLSSYFTGHIGAFKLGAHESVRDGMVSLDAWPSKGPRAYEHWGFHNSSSKNYRAQAKASVSPSGKKVIFSSDWQDQTRVEEYILSID